MKKILFLLMVLVLTACADWPETGEELWASPAGKKVFATPMNYNDAYKITFANASKCFSKGDLRTSGMLKSKLGKGEIRIGVYGPDAPATVLMEIAIVATGEGSQVTVVYAAKAWDEKADLPDAWVNKGHTGCDKASL